MNGEAGFDHVAEIHFDELDPMRMLHNTRYAVHVERALNAFFWSLGRSYAIDVAQNPDQFHVVKEFCVEFLVPFLGTGPMTTTIWVERLGGSSCTYGFLCASPEPGLIHARGHRTIVKLDPTTLRPAPWTEWFKESNSPLVRRSLQPQVTSTDVKRSTAAPMVVAGAASRFKATEQQRPTRARRTA